MKQTRYILLFFLFTSISLSTFGQNKEVPKSDSKREEIQRYFGYEKLLLRYYTTPYDVTMNVNERGNFLDIGYLYLIFLPLLLLLLYRRDKLFVILTVLFLLLLLIVSTSNSFVFDSSVTRLYENRNGKFVDDTPIDTNLDPIGSMTKGIYEINNGIYGVVNNVFENITGDEDAITYPILLLLFALYSYFFLKRINLRKFEAKHLLIIIVWFYSFLWFLLSAGIVWYGYLMLLLSLILIVKVLNDQDANDSQVKLLRYSFYTLATLWIGLGLVNRISNVNPATPPDYQGFGMYNPYFHSFSAGTISKKRNIALLYPNLDNAVEYINRPKFKDDLVYRIGTSFTYFIDNNHKRVFIDNQLGFFNQLVKKYPEKQNLAKALRASNFSFIIVDLFTPTIDRTPERTLTKKYNTFMNFVYKNDMLVLRGTDRTIKSNKPKVKKEFGVFGDIVDNGSYAIYEILEK